MTEPAIVHDDGAVLVLAKPAGMPTVPYRAGDRESCLRAWVEARLGKRVFVVHRLDKETSGLVAFAHDAATHRRLSMAFERRAVGKQYLAVVLGHVAQLSGAIVAPLREFGSGRGAVAPDGKPARSRFALRE